MAFIADRAGDSLTAARTDAILARSEGNRSLPKSSLPAWPTASSRDPFATCFLSVLPGSTHLRRTCFAWLQPPVATSHTRCCVPWPGSPSTTYGNCSDRPSTAVCSSPTRPGAPSGSVTLCLPRPCTPRSCPANAKSSMPGSPASSNGPIRRPLLSWHRTGRLPAAPPRHSAASVEAARQAEAVFGLAEARGHLERALALWPAVPDSPERAGLDFPTLCSWAAELASLTGAAPRAVELSRQAIGLVGGSDPTRAAGLYDNLARYLHESGETDAASRLANVPSSWFRNTHPRHQERRRSPGWGTVWGSCGATRSRSRSASGPALARSVGSPEARSEASITLGVDLAYLGHADEGVERLWSALGSPKPPTIHIPSSGPTSISPTC